MLQRPASRSPVRPARLRNSRSVCARSVLDCPSCSGSNVTEFSHVLGERHRASYCNTFPLRVRGNIAREHLSIDLRPVRSIVQLHNAHLIEDPPVGFRQRKSVVLLRDIRVRISSPAAMFAGIPPCELVSLVVRQWLPHSHTPDRATRRHVSAYPLMPACIVVIGLRLAPVKKAGDVLSFSWAWCTWAGFRIATRHVRTRQTSSATRHHPRARTASLSTDSGISTRASPSEDPEGARHVPLDHDGAGCRAVDVRAIVVIAVGPVDSPSGGSELDPRAPWRPLLNRLVWTVLR